MFSARYAGLVLRSPLAQELSTARLKPPPTTSRPLSTPEDEFHYLDADDEDELLRTSPAPVFPSSTKRTPDETGETTSAAPAKKRRIRRTECDICNTETTANRLPKAAHEGAASHEGKVCFNCWEQRLQAEVEEKPWDQVCCPQCCQTLREEEIRRLAPSVTNRKLVYADLVPVTKVLTSIRWLDKAARSYQKKDEEYRACPSASYSWGCFMSTREDGNIFTCQTCKYRYCIICETPMHEDETWVAYQERRREEAKRGEENKLSTEEVSKVSKPCPACGVNLDKWIGCD